MIVHYELHFCRSLDADSRWHRMTFQAKISADLMEVELKKRGYLVRIEPVEQPTKLTSLEINS